MAHSASLEHTLDEAFSRRMCCSRAWRVRTKHRRPSRRWSGFPIRPGSLAHHGLLTGHKAEVGAAEGQGHAQGLALSTAMSTPYSPGVFSRPREMGLTPHDHLGPARGQWRPYPPAPPK